MPASESQGIGELDVYGDCFSNLPPPPKQYIERPVLEAELLEQLHLVERRPILTLTGRGGIGKTYLALKVLHQLVGQDSGRFKVIIWFSARDIDLLPEGPKLVQPHVLSIDEFADEYVRLVEPAERAKDYFKATDFLKSEMSRSELGPILFVFDNFETVKDPAEIFSWIDTFVRPPNKVLITTRKREFNGDWQIHVSGMSEDECAELISVLPQLNIERD